MLFNSPLYLLVFMPIFYLLYFIMPEIKYHNAVIVVFSILFFAWGDPVFVWYVIAGTYVDYIIIKYILIDTIYSEKNKKVWVIIAVMINISALLFFKYANFFIDQAQPVMNKFGFKRPSWYGIALPLGISFIAFHKISFIVDLYKKRTSPPASFLNCLLYILFFPQLIAGPIIRYHEISMQIEKRRHTSQNFISGFFRFAIGLCKKALIADPAGNIADAIFALNPESLPIHYAWIGAIGFTIQIYFDFSGYSDMAIGIARIVGFRFPENFNQPYISKSITEFWQRWHITLSNWMRLYLYIPLGGNRVSSWRMYLNLWIVFFISGFWHGASWNFILWGIYYGFFLTLEKIIVRHSFIIHVPKLIKQMLTFILIINAWVLFRANTVEYATKFLSRMFGIIPQSQHVAEPFSLIFEPHGLSVIIIGLLLGLVPFPNIKKYLKMEKDSLKFDLIQWGSSIMMFFCSLSAIMATESKSFLYFRF